MSMTCSFVVLMGGYYFCCCQSVKNYHAYYFALFFCVGIKKILKYCKEQGECSEEDCTNIMKKYELL
jgi:hypothetical protein